MKLSVLMLSICAALFAISPTPVAAQSLSPELKKLDVSVGRWVFHGKELKTKSDKPGAFTWNEDCRWSPNRLYLECTFSNVWAGKPIESLVVDTYNTRDRSYWHYVRPIASVWPSKLQRMASTGPPWTKAKESSSNSEAQRLGAGSASRNHSVVYVISSLRIR